jgi:hypothetical protein
MASALSFTLSAEDLALFRELQSNALFTALATPLMNPVAEVVKQKHKETERDRLEPYADILLPILLAKIKLQSDESLAELMEAAKKGAPLEVNSLWWNTVIYNRSLTEKQRAESVMTYEERRAASLREHDLRDELRASGSEHMVGIRTPSYGYEEYDAENYTLWPVKVDRILRVTDLRYRLALALGPNFFPSIRWAEEVNRVEGEEGHSVRRKELVFRYYPFGLDKFKMKTMLAAFKRQKQREADGLIATLGVHDWVECEKGEWARPPLAFRTNGGGIAPPAPVSLLGVGAMDPRFLYRSEADGVHAYPLPSPPRLERQNAEAPGAPRKGFAPKDLFMALNEAAGAGGAHCFCGCDDESED